MLHLKCKTPSAWASNALNHLDEILVDHAHCEHKAAVSALSLCGHYPDDPQRVKRLARLAQEEAGHYAMMVAVCAERDLKIGHPKKDLYVKALLKEVRQGYLNHFMDRLLIAALIEARSCERLKILSDILTDPKLKKLYEKLWHAEAGHHMLFVELAQEAVVQHMPTSPAKAKTIVQQRLEELTMVEADIVQNQPIRAAIH